MKGSPAWVDFIDNTAMTKRIASVITRMELLSFPGIGTREENGIHRFLSELAVLTLDAAVENTAIAIRLATGLKLPDAVIASTTVIAGCNAYYSRPTPYRT